MDGEPELKRSPSVFKIDEEPEFEKKPSTKIRNTRRKKFNYLKSEIDTKEIERRKNIWKGMRFKLTAKEIKEGLGIELVSFENESKPGNIFEIGEEVSKQESGEGKSNMIRRKRRVREGAKTNQFSLNAKSNRKLF